MTELLPCPFCGGEVTFNQDASVEENGFDEYSVSCENGACGTRACTFGYELPNEAIDAWNTRAAVTEEQFAIAVHDGDAWQKVRTCEMAKIATGNRADYDCAEAIWHCESCHAELAVYAFGEDGDVWAEQPAYCPNCGAKVVEP